jgi:chromosome segregation ATPase
MAENSTADREALERDRALGSIRDAMLAIKSHLEQIDRRLKSMEDKLERLDGLTPEEVRELAEAHRELEDATRQSTAAELEAEQYGGRAA